MSAACPELHVMLSALSSPRLMQAPERRAASSSSSSSSSSASSSSSSSYQACVHAHGHALELQPLDLSPRLGTPEFVRFNMELANADPGYGGKPPDSCAFHQNHHHHHHQQQQQQQHEYRSAQQDDDNTAEQQQQHQQQQQQAAVVKAEAQPMMSCLLHAASYPHQGHEQQHQHQQQHQQLNGAAAAREYFKASPPHTPPSAYTDMQQEQQQQQHEQLLQRTWDVGAALGALPFPRDYTITSLTELGVKALPAPRYKAPQPPSASSSSVSPPAPYKFYLPGRDAPGGDGGGARFSGYVGCFHRAPAGEPRAGFPSAEPLPPGFPGDPDAHRGLQGAPSASPAPGYSTFADSLNTPQQQQQRLSRGPSCGDAARAGPRAAHGGYGETDMGVSRDMAMAFAAGGPLSSVMSGGGESFGLGVTGRGPRGDSSGMGRGSAHGGGVPLAPSPTDYPRGLQQQQQLMSQRYEDAESPGRFGARRFPTPASPAPSEGMCAVCGDNAACQHYGVRTCEGCKGFFKRTVQKNAKYVCLASRSCPVDKRRRNRCQFCRFQKCLSVGMIREVVRTDSLKGRRGRLPSKPKGAGAGRGPGRVGSPGEGQQLGQQQLGQHHGSGGNALLCGVARAHHEAWPAAAHLDYSMYSPAAEHDPEGPPAEAAHVRVFYELLATSAEASRAWASRLPGFPSLARPDQDTLLDAAILELFVLRLAYRSRPREGRMVFCAGQVLHPSQCLRAFGEWMEPILEFSTSLQSLQMDATAFACLEMMVLLTDRRELREPKRVADLRRRVQQSSREHVGAAGPVAARLAGAPTELRALCTQGLQRLFYLKLEELVPAPPVVERLFRDTLPF